MIRELLQGRMRRVVHTRRFSGHPLLRQETVAEHSYLTAHYALCIAISCVREGSRDIDYGKLLSRAIMHDVDEAVSGDLLRPIKYSSPEFRAMWEKISKDAMYGLCREMDMPELYPIWEHAKDDSLEGEILALADLISVHGYLQEEIAMGNTLALKSLRESVPYLTEFASRCCAHLRALTEECITLSLSILDEHAKR
jgi:5'-deoxynucleotidase YfbR-like HD superfamily hydrolase